MTPPETVYTLEIGGSGILTFGAASMREAMSLRHESWLQADLREARSQGAPIWDGEAKITIRRATADEAKRYADGQTAAADDSGDLVFVYLVELDK
jgi:hypothetical protein